MTQETTGTMTSEDFERWLNLQTMLGYTVKNPEAVDYIRAQFKLGATCTPFRQVDHLTTKKQFTQQHSIQ